MFTWLAVTVTQAVLTGCPWLAVKILPVTHTHTNSGPNGHVPHMQEDARVQKSARVPAAVHSSSAGSSVALISSG